MKIPEPVLNRMLTQSLRRREAYRWVRSEVVLGPGMRADILAKQPDGALVLFELKARTLRQRDVSQVVRYARYLEQRGHTVHAHLVGDGWVSLERPGDVVFLDWSFFWGQIA